MVLSFNKPLSINKRNKYIKLMVKYQQDLISQGIKCNIIGERVHFFREAKELGKSAFCDLAQIERTTLYKIESGQITPSYKTLCKIVDALNIPDADGFVLPQKEFNKRYNNYVPEKFSNENICNIYNLEKEILNIIQNATLTYYLRGEIKHFPTNYLKLLVKNISASFSILDMIKHDQKQGDVFSITEFLNEQKELDN